MTIIEEFNQAKAILSGHFILSSGLRSDTYLQCARLLMDPSRAERICKQLAEKIIHQLGTGKFDLVVSPAMGGVVVGYEIARQLGLPSIFCERVDGKFTLRRGFNIEPGARILVIEDVLTTGKSSLETFDCIREYGGQVIAEGCIVDRSAGKADLGVPLVSLLELQIDSFPADQLPIHLQQIPAIKPGSRA